MSGPKTELATLMSSKLSGLFLWCGYVPWSSNDLPVLEVGCEWITHGVKCNRVVLSHYIKREDVQDTLWFEPSIHLEEGLVSELFGWPYDRIGMHIFLVIHCLDSCQKVRVLEQVQCRWDIEQDPCRWDLPLIHLLPWYFVAAVWVTVHI